MPKVQRLNAFNNDGLTALNEFIDVFNTGIADVDVRESAGISTSKLNLYIKKGVTVTTSETTIPHFLGKPPRHVSWSMASSGSVYRSKDSDSRNVYLISPSGTQTVDVCVWG